MKTTTAIEALLATADVQDPTDFPAHAVAPGLRQLDASLRCNICGELLEGPVTVPCGHCFCSRCIRSAIGEKSQCPQCRKPADESQLRINPAMEEAVTAWKLARPLVLRMSKGESAGLERLSSPSFAGSPRKRRRSEVSDASSDVLDVQEVPGPSGPREQALSSDTPAVICPICEQRVSLKSINKHIDDNCRPEPPPTSSDPPQLSSKSQWSKIMGSGRKSKGKDKQADGRGGDPLPKASYAVLKDRQIKDLLSEHGLPVAGDRQTLIARHQRWVILYNANLDHSPALRQSVPELRAELTQWEVETKGKGKAKIEVKDSIAYQKANKAQFAQLTAAARPKKVQAGNEPMTPTHPTTNGEASLIDVDSERGSPS